jgi:serine/threonine protein kinase
MDLVGKTVLGRYRVVQQLGSGGQGMVYLARSEGAAGFVRPVVVKHALSHFEGDTAALDTFAREARIMSQLRHPNIVSVIDFERAGDSHVLVMEYVHGYDLKRWARYVREEHGHFAPEVVVHLMLHVLEALHHAHTLRAADGSRRRVIHRDISPANVLIDANGQVKLTDFGVARMDADEVTQVTTHLQIKGKLAYVAPELYLGFPPSVASDVYACGVMMHELYLGKNEFRADAALETMRLTREHVPTRVDRVRSDVPREHAEALARALAKDPAQRFASALDFAEALTTRGADFESTFRAVVREHFADPRLPKLLGTPPLRRLDAAWRNLSDLADRLEPSRPEHASERIVLGAADSARPLAQTVVASPLNRRLRDSEALKAGAPASAAPPPSRELRASDQPRARRFNATSALLAVSLVAALAAAALLGWRTASDDSPRFVYVHHEPATSEPALAPQKPNAPSLAGTRDGMRAAQLSAVFAERSGAIEACFERHPSAAEALTGVEVELAIDPRGHVSRAALVPAALGQSELGRCIVDVALGTEFGKQPGGIVARIPITARVVR